MPQVFRFSHYKHKYFTEKCENLVAIEKKFGLTILLQTSAKYTHTLHFTYCTSILHILKLL